MNIIKKIRTKLKLRTRLFNFISSQPSIQRYKLRNKLTTFEKHCTKIESFPTNEEMISKDWYLSIRSPETTQRKLPISLDDIALKKVKNNYLNTTKYKEIPEFFLSCINKAKLLSNNIEDGFWALSSEDYFLSDLFYKNDILLEESGILNTIMFPPFIPILRHYPGDYCLLATPYWSGNYYHWMVDILPRLSLLEQFEQLQRIPLILPKKLKAYQKESLQLAGVSPERMVCLERGYYQVDKLYFPSYLSMIGNTSKHAISWLRKRFLAQDTAQESSSKGYLYISRSDASIRRVINEDKIIEFLSSIGFEIITLGKMPFVEQIKTFSSAKVVIAPHGAGLTNIIFAPPNTTVIEMFPETKNQVDGCYWTIADTCGYNYAFLTGPYAGADTTNTERIIATGWDDRDDRNRDFYISLDQLKALLDKVGVGGSPLP